MCHKCYRNFLINLRQLLKCGICGHTQKLQFHHIKPTKLNGHSRGLWRRAIDIRDHPDCYIPLCYFCHQKVTLGDIKIFFNRIEDSWVWIDATSDVYPEWTEGDLVRLNVLR